MQRQLTPRRTGLSGNLRRWSRDGTLRLALEALAEDLRERGEVDLSDGTKLMMAADDAIQDQISLSRRIMFMMFPGEPGLRLVRRESDPQPDLPQGLLAPRFPCRRDGGRAIYGAFFFGFLLMIPAGVIALLGAYVRRGFAKSLDAEGATASPGRKFYWGKLYHVNHVTKYFRAGGVSRKVKDNQLELVFEGGKVIIPPLIHDRARVWELINSMPAEVRDDGVPRAGRVPTSEGEPVRTQEDLMRLLESMRGTHHEGG